MVIGGKQGVADTSGAPAMPFGSLLISAAATVNSSVRAQTSFTYQDQPTRV